MNKDLPPKELTTEESKDEDEYLSAEDLEKAKNYVHKNSNGYQHSVIIATDDLKSIIGASLDLYGYVYSSSPIEKNATK